MGEVLPLREAAKRFVHRPARHRPRPLSYRIGERMKIWHSPKLYVGLLSYPHLWRWLPHFIFTSTGHYEDGTAFRVGMWGIGRWQVEFTYYPDGRHA